MFVIVERKDKNVIAKLDGEIDHHCASYVREKIDAELCKGNVRTLIIDFKNVTFMDSSGLGIIFGRYNKLVNIGAELVITNVPKRIERILRMAGVYTLIKQNYSER